MQPCAVQRGSVDYAFLKMDDKLKIALKKTRRTTIEILSFNVRQKNLPVSEKYKTPAISQSS